MRNDTTACVATFPSELEADMARMTLDSHGIDAFVTKDDCGGMRPWMQPLTGVKLIVSSLEAKRASQILAEIEQQDG